MKSLVKSLLIAAGFLSIVRPSFSQTVTASRTIRSKSLILASDVTVLEGTVPGTFRRADQVVGQEARSILYPGRPIRASDVGPPAIVARNEIVTMVFSSGSLVILAEGRALARGGLGDTIRVMNSTSRTTVMGVVTGPALIKVIQ